MDKKLNIACVQMDCQIGDIEFNTLQAVKYIHQASGMGADLVVLPELFNVGYDFNHESQFTQQYMDQILKYWLTEFKADGFRFDLSKGFTQKNTLGNTGAWGQYDGSRIYLLKRMRDEIRKYDNNAVLILEHFADNSEETELSNEGFYFWGNGNTAYSEIAMGYGYKSMIGIFSNNRLEWSITDYGILAIRGIVVPFFGTATKEQVKYIVDETKMEVMC